MRPPGESASNVGLFAREDVCRRDLVVDRRRSLRVVERRHQRPRRILHRAEDAQTLLRSFDAHFRGIGAEERRRARDRGVVGDREMQRQMMAFDAPAPRALRRGRTENGEEVELGIANVRALPAVRVFDRVEEDFELHDRGGGQVALLAEAGFEQLVRELALRLGHFLPRHALAREHVGRDEVPADLLFRVDRKRGLLALLGRQRLEPLAGGGRHRCRGAARRRPLRAQRDPCPPGGQQHGGRRPGGETFSTVG